MRPPTALALLVDLAALALCLQAAARWRAARAELEVALPHAAPLRSEPTGGAPPAPREGVLDLARLQLPDYDPPEVRADPAPLAPADLPARVRALAGREWTVWGHLVPLELERGRARRYYLSRFPPGCCYGRRPVVDEWLDLELPEPIDPPDPEVPRALTGTLEIGELVDEAGYVQSLYRLRDARLE